MCQHTTLAQNSDGFILWCNECSVYRVHFSSIVMVLDCKGLESFKSSLTNCYQENRRHNIPKNQKYLFFNTQVDGLQLWFSVQDVGSLLSLLQEAALSHCELSYYQP